MKSKQPAPMSVRLPEKTTTQLRLIAENQGIPRNRLVADVIHQFIKQTEIDQTAA